MTYHQKSFTGNWRAIIHAGYWSGQIRHLGDITRGIF